MKHTGGTRVGQPLHQYRHFSAEGLFRLRFGRYDFDLESMR
jgi:hypothetical protein